MSSEVTKYSILFAKVHPDAKIPEIPKLGNSGIDITTVDEDILMPGQRRLFKTGLVVELPFIDSEFQVRPRSGLALEHGITVLNTPGTIDANYRGEIGIILINLGCKSFKVEKHMKIAQLVYARVETISSSTIDIEEALFEELSSTNRGEKGFGSSGLF